MTDMRRLSDEDRIAIIESYGPIHRMTWDDDKVRLFVDCDTGTIIGIMPDSFIPNESMRLEILYTGVASTMWRIINDK